MENKPEPDKNIIPDIPTQNQKFEPKVKDFGFGEIEEKKYLDPDIFEEEVEVKAAREYFKEQRFEDGVEAEFSKPDDNIPFFEESVPDSNASY